MAMMTRHLLALAAVALLLGGCSDAVTPVDTDPVSVPEVGQLAPDFTQADTAGHPISLSQFRGKVVLIDFWASWCSPCIGEIPSVRAMWQKHRDNGFVVLSVSLDNSLDDWRSFLRLNNMDWYQVSDGKYWNNAVARRYGIEAIPAMYLVGRDGKILEKGTDGWVITEETVARYVQ